MAIADDLGSIVVIAFFYASELSVGPIAIVIRYWLSSDISAAVLHDLGSAFDRLAPP